MQLSPPAFFAFGLPTDIELLNHLWQSTVVAVAILALILICHRLPARTRRALAWMALAKFVVPLALLAPLVTFVGRLFGGWYAPPTLPLPSDWAAGSVVLPMAGFESSASPDHSLPLGLTAAWLSGWLLLLAAWLVRGAAFRRRVIATAEPASDSVTRRLAELAKRLGVRHPPGCLATDAAGPGIIGLASPILILPRGLEHALNPPELDAVLVHELIHFQRRDNLWSLGQAVLVRLLWFNPVTWLLNHRLNAETEKSCDERVVQITADPENYVSGIIKSARHALGLGQPGLAGATTPPVVSRIRNILSLPARRSRPLARAAAIATGAVLLVLSGQVGSFTVGALAAQPDAPPPVAAASDNASPPPAAATAPAPESLVTEVFVLNYARAADIAPIIISLVDPAAGGKVLVDSRTNTLIVTERLSRMGTVRPTVVTLDGPGLISIDYEDADIRVILREVADQLGLNLAMPASLQGRKTVKLRNVTWRQIYSVVLEGTGHTFLEEERIVRVAPGTVPLRPPTRDTSRDQETITVDFPDEDVRNILRNVADLYRLNLTMPDELRGKTTIKLRGVTWRQIFQTVLDPLGYTYVEDANIIRIVPKSVPAPQASAPPPSTAPVVAAVEAERIASPGPSSPPASRAIAPEVPATTVASDASAADHLLSIHIAADNKLYWKVGSGSPELIIPADLGPRLKSFHDRYGPQTRVTLLGDHQSRVDLITRVFEQVQKAGFQSASLRSFDRAAGDVFDLTAVEAKPQARFRTPPTYPFELRRERIGGEVLIEFIVDPSGNVTNPIVLKATHEAFVAPALKAIGKWKFRPGMKGGREVSTRMQAPIVFSVSQ
jgi:TonB family protein